MDQKLSKKAKSNLFKLVISMMKMKTTDALKFSSGKLEYAIIRIK